MAVYGSNYEYGNSPLYKDEGWDDANSLFYFLPNWKFNVSLFYRFVTVITQTRKKFEQRTSLIPKPKRRESFVVTTDDTFEELWHYLIQQHAATFYIPIYTEPVIPDGAGSMQGLNTFNVNNVRYFFNLRNMTTFLLLIDNREIVTAEILVLNTVTDTQIQVAENIVGDFQYNNSIIFPLFHCYLTGKERINITDKMTQFNLEFTESEVYD